MAKRKKKEAAPRKERTFSPEFKAFQKKRNDELKYGLLYYVNSDAAAMIPDTVVEYRRIRNIAMNRIRKLERAGYGETETVKQARQTFEQLPRNLTQQQAAALLPDAARFITSARGTVGGMREIERKTMETFQSRGLDFVNRGNIRQFTEYLDYLGSKKLAQEYYKRTRAPREGHKRTKAPLKVSKLETGFKRWQKQINSYNKVFAGL